MAPPLERERKQQHDRPGELQWPVRQVDPRPIAQQRHNRKAKCEISGVGAHHSPPGVILRGEHMRTGDDERQCDEDGHCDRHCACEPRAICVRERQRQRCERKKLDQRPDREGAGGSGLPSPLDRNERHHDQPGYERVAGRALQRGDERGVDQQQRHRRGSPRQEPVDRRVQQRGVQQVPEQEAHGERKRGERRKEQGGRRTVLESVLRCAALLRRIGGVEITSGDEMMVRLPEDGIRRV